MTDEAEGFRERISRQGEEALGKLTEELLANPVVAGALQRALDAREKAVQAQEAAMGVLGIPSAADVERVTRRLRSVSQRLEAVEDSLDRIEERIGSLDSRLAGASGLEPLERKLDELDSRVTGALQLEPLERRLDELARELTLLREAVAPAAEPVPRAQERLTVSEP